MPKKSEKKKIKDKAWTLFSQYIRRRDSDKHGYCNCCTCGKKAPWKELQAGHFIAGRNASILFEEDAVHAQCVGCNLFGGGKQAQYYAFMKEKYGLKRIDELYTQANQVKKVSVSDYMELIDDLMDKLVGLDIRDERED